MHDGRRIFFLPFEAAFMASPPDLEACWLTQARVECLNRSLDGEPASLCPDRDWCRFDLAINAGDVIGIVVFDIDADGYGLLRDGTTAASGLLSRAAGKDENGWVADMARAGQANVHALATANENRSEWIDALILAENPDDPRIRIVSERIRDLVIARAPPGHRVDRTRSRLAGEFLVRHPQDCVSPAPACFLDYSTLQFEPKAGISLEEQKHD